MYCRDGAFVVLVYWFRLTWSRIAAATSDSFGPDVFVVCFVGFILLFPRFLVFLLFCFRSRSVLFRQLLLIFYVCELWGFLAMHIIVNTCERAHTHTQEWRERERVFGCCFFLFIYSFAFCICLEKQKENSSTGTYTFVSVKRIAYYTQQQQKTTKRSERCIHFTILFIHWRCCARLPEIAFQRG